MSDGAMRANLHFFMVLRRRWDTLGFVLSPPSCMMIGLVIVRLFEKHLLVLASTLEA